MQMQYKQISDMENFKKQEKLKKEDHSTNTRTGNPLLRKMSTTLLPTPPVAPATRTMPEVSMAFTGSLGDGPDSFSTRNSTNFQTITHVRQCKTEFNCR